jgi:hypothetical protein
MSEREQRLAYEIDEFCKITPFGRTTVYKDIAEGRLRAVKNGRRTIILHPDAMAYLAALPAIEPRGGNSPQHHLRALSFATTKPPLTKKNSGRLLFARMRPGSANGGARRCPS